MIRANSLQIHTLWGAGRWLPGPQTLDTEQPARLAFLGTLYGRLDAAEVTVRRVVPIRYWLVKSITPTLPFALTTFIQRAWQKVGRVMQPAISRIAGGGKVIKSINVAAPHPLLIKLRDKFWPGYRFSLRTEIGLLPYDKNDLVASSLVRGTFEPEEQAVMRALLPACRGMMDIGANLGLYTLLASRLMPKEGRIVAFEASPIEYAKLSWTISRNQLSNVEVVHAAVSDELGTTTIYQSLTGAGALNRVDRPAKTSGSWEPAIVSMTTIDEWAAANSNVPIDLLKIDVEGHELPVLFGAQSLLRNWRPLILIEVNAARASARSAPREIWDHLIGLGYRWFAIQSGVGVLMPADEPGAAINFLAVPCEPLSNAALADTLSALIEF